MILQGTFKGGLMSIGAVLCTYNGENFINAQISSIASQGIEISHLIIMDDCSTDSTVQKIETFLTEQQNRLSSYSVLLQINKTRIGVSKNFEVGLHNSIADWILLADQDDVWFKNKTSSFELAINKLSVPGVINSDGDLVDKELVPLGQTLFQSLAVTAKEKRMINEGFAYKVLLRRNVYTGAAMAVHREVVKEATPFPNRWMHDEWLAITSAFLFSNFLIDEPTFAYRQHSKNLIGAKTLTLRNKISKYREPREERNINLYQRAKILYEFAVANNWETKSHVPNAILLLERNRAFHKQRLLLPVSRLQRLLFVARLYVRGDYNTFSLGLRDAIRDITQPAPLGKLSEETQFKSSTK